MTKQQLIENFDHNHKELIAFIDALTDQEFAYSYKGKWTAGQQLDHVYLCLKPINQALSSKDFILQKFGKINRPVSDYDQVIEHYKAALAKGGKAPDQFVPQQFNADGRRELSAQFIEILQRIREQLGSYTDEELDSLVLPHPLLGLLTIRELFYLMTYHATHHLKQTELNLAQDEGH